MISWLISLRPFLILYGSFSTQQREFWNVNVGMSLPCRRAFSSWRASSRLVPCHHHGLMSILLLVPSTATPPASLLLFELTKQAPPLGLSHSGTFFALMFTLFASSLHSGPLSPFRYLPRPPYLKAFLPCFSLLHLPLSVPLVDSHLLSYFSSASSVM